MPSHKLVFSSHRVLLELKFRGDKSLGSSSLSPEKQARYSQGSTICKLKRWGMVKSRERILFRMDWKEEQIKESRDSRAYPWWGLGGIWAFSLSRGWSVTGGMWKWAVPVRLTPGWSLSQFWVSKVLKTPVAISAWGQQSGPSAPEGQVIRMNCP